MLCSGSGVLPAIEGIMLTVLIICGHPDAQSQPIQGGSFRMGNSNGDTDEQPVHSITLSPFKMDACEVTESSYDSCVAAGRCSPAHYDDGVCRAWNGSRFVTARVPVSFRNRSFPVVCVTWHQARQFCRSRGMDLPTEAQWEYAAGAATGEVGYNGAAAEKKTVSGRTGGPTFAGSGIPNGLGLYDMLGNVWEWVNDYYDPQWYAVSDTANPAGPEVGFYRVIRGGGWYSESGRVSATDRQWYSPDFSEVSIGFRCVSRSRDGN